MKLKKIKEIINNNSYVKYLLVFLIVFFISFGVNYFLIHDLENHINDKHISYKEFVVVDKYISNEGTHDYIIVSDNNNSYEIVNDKDGVNIFNRIENGHRYHFVLRNDSNCEYPHIIQVYDERK